MAIAEAGVNHNCDMGLAKRLVDEAMKRGAHIVKFQAFVAEEEISKFADKAQYQKDTTGNSGGQLEMAKALELTHSQLTEIRNYCFSIGMPFLCSAFDSISLKFLANELKVKSIKIASSEVTNHPFLAEVAQTGAGCILSTGASNLDEVAEAMKVLKSAGAKDIVLMHCVSNYPADMNQINLRAIQTMKQLFKVPVGYSDHTIGFEAPIIACALGAVTVEKHFTLDRNMAGPDHRASVEPHELEAMVKGMSAAFYAQGDGIKRAVPCEEANRLLIRKSIVVRRDLPIGHILSENDLGYKRPLSGIEPFDWKKVVGKSLSKDMKEDQALKWDDLK